MRIKLEPKLLKELRGKKQWLLKVCVKLKHLLLKLTSPLRAGKPWQASETETPRKDNWYSDMFCGFCYSLDKTKVIHHAKERISFSWYHARNILLCSLVLSLFLHSVSFLSIVPCLTYTD